MTYPATTYAEGVELTITSGNQLHEIINGDATEEINTESGMVPSVRKALADSMLFKPAIAWAEGSVESDPFQTRLYGEGIYWAPAASNETPISMGTNPNIDGNWFLAPVYQNKELVEENSLRINENGENISELQSENSLQDERISINESDISALQSGQGSGVVGYATQVELFADLNYDESSIGYVTNDTTATNNGTYRKVGASGAGSWVQSSSDLASQAYQKSTENEQKLETLESIEGDVVDEAFEITAEDGSVITRFDSNGQRTKGNNTSDFVGVRDVSGEVSGGMEGQSSQRNQMTIEANDNSVIASFGGDDFKIERLNISELSTSKNKRNVFTDGLMASTVNASTIGPEVNHVIQLGRSLAEGRGNIVFDNPSFRNVSRIHNQDSDSALASPQATGVYTNEQYQFSMAEYFFELLKRKKNIDGNDISFHMHLDNVAVGGTTIEDLITLTIPRIRERIASAKAFYESMGVKYNFLCFMFTHSESDDRMINSYYNGVTSYISQCRQIVEDEVGQNASTVPWFTQPWDNGSDTANGTWRLFEAEDDRVHYRISEEDPYVFITGKTSVCERKTAELTPPETDGLHLSGPGTVQAGMQFAIGLYDYFIDQYEVKSLQPERVYSYGNNVFIEYPRWVNLEERTTTGNSGTDIAIRTVDLGMVVSNKDPETQYNVATDYERFGTQSIASKNVVKIEIPEGIASGDYLYVSGSDLIHRLRDTVYDVTYGGSSFEVYLPVHPCFVKIVKVD